MVVLCHSLILKIIVQILTKNSVCHSVKNTVDRQFHNYIITFNVGIQTMMQEDELLLILFDKRDRYNSRLMNINNKHEISTETFMKKRLYLYTFPILLTAKI